MNDPTSGFRAANKKAIEYLAMNYPMDYPEPESLVDLARHSFRVGEVQVNMHELEGGVSPIFLWKSVYYMVKVSLANICCKHTHYGAFTVNRNEFIIICYCFNTFGKIKK